MPCEALVLHMAGGFFFRHGPSGAGQARQKPFAPRSDAASLPVYESIPPNRCSPASPLHDLFSPRSLKQPLGLLPLCGNVPVPPFARKGCRRRPQAPAQKKRNFLDLWQTIAQDLSRLFAVPGGCPSCPGSRKDWPEPLFCFRRPVPAPSLLPAAFRKALCAVWPEHDAHADTAGAYALPPCSPTTTPGDRSGMAARGAAIQSHGPE